MTEHARGGSAHRKLILTLVAGAAGAAALSACGETGPLQQPAPLFGRAAKEQYYGDRAQQQRSSAAARQAQQNEVGSAEREAANTVDNDQPLTTREVQDPDSKLTTPRNAPVPGEPNPLGATVSTTPPN